MTLHFRNVFKKVRGRGNNVTFQDVSFSIDEKDRVAFLGHKESGLDSLIKIICGADAPDQGQVVCTHAVSWPIPNPKFLHRHVSLAGNARFVARLYEVDERAYLRDVTRNGKLEQYMNQRLDNCKRSIVNDFAFSLGITLPFPTYILSSAHLSDRLGFRNASEMLDSMGRSSGLLVSASKSKGISEMCDKGVVLDDGKVTFHDSIEEAVEHFDSLSSKDDDDDDADIGDEDGAESRDDMRDDF